MKNNKGFTLIEMLGTIVVLGILSTIAVLSVTKILNNSKQKAYETMSQSIYEAAMNCLIEGKCTVSTTITSATLQSNGYLDTLKNPISSKDNCKGSVSVISRGDGDYKDYQYTVNLSCDGMPDTYNSITWPKES